MKRLLLPGLFLAMTFGKGPSACADTVSPWLTFVPGYPPDAQKKGITGVGVVRVTTDQYGWVKEARMTRATGSGILDEATLKAARLYWQGPPYTTHEVSVQYRLTAAGPGERKPSSLVIIPPGGKDKTGSIEASGIIKVATDSSGHVVRGVITRSSGSEVLDENTMKFALGAWTGPRSSVYEVPVKYQIPR